MALSAERIVIDSGFILESALPTTRENKAQAEKLISRLQTGQTIGVVPWIFFNEIATVLARRVRSGKLKDDEAQVFFDQLETCKFEPVFVLIEPRNLYDIAIKMGCQIVDSIYVRMAKSHGLSIATVDGGMIQAAIASKIGLYIP
jgi:predicted nucleic acid-binding protein